MSTARAMMYEELAFKPWRERFSEKRSRVDDPSIREILQVATKRGILSFAGGFPDPSLLPISQIAEISSGVMREFPLAVAQYGVSDGVLQLREELARWATDDYRPCAARNVAITTGGQ